MKGARTLSFDYHGIKIKIEDQSTARDGVTYEVVGTAGLVVGVGSTQSFDHALDGALATARRVLLERAAQREREGAMERQRLLALWSRQPEGDGQMAAASSDLCEMQSPRRDQRP